MFQQAKGVAILTDYKTLSIRIKQLLGSHRPNQATFGQLKAAQRTRVTL